MKRVTSIVLFCIFFQQTTLAQVRTGGRNEISASYGFVTNSQLLDALLGLGIAFGSLGELTYNATDYSGGLFITYRRSSANNRFHYGIAAGYDKISGDFSNQSGSKKGDFTDTNITLAAEGAVSYMNKPTVRLYGLLGAGYTFNSYKNTVKIGGNEIETLKGSYPNFQFTPIGASFGKNIGGYIELGLGYKGILNLGLYARF